MGGLHLALFSFAGPGKGPLLMAEHFAFQQGFRDGGAVDCDERMLRSWTVAVDGTGHHFFPGAALAFDQDGGVRGSHAPDEFVDLLHARTAADHVVLHQHLPSQIPVLLFEFLEVPQVMQSQTRHGRHRGYDLEVSLLKTVCRILAVEVNGAYDLLGNLERDTQQRTHRCIRG